jgi:2,3-bisphosphoglycerate-independent phosphoglycerate mutase
MGAGTLLILDGWGQAEAGPANAIAMAATPNLKQALGTGSSTLLEASGRAVGLPAGAVGNSEIGHMVIGAGRALDYDSLLVQRQAESGMLRRHPLLLGVCARLRGEGRALHLVGLCSDGQIHSHIDHFEELLAAASEAGLERVFLHAITDGRDVANGTAPQYLERLLAMAARTGVGTIASVVGREYAMDKAGRLELTDKAYRAIADGEGAPARSAAEAVALNQTGKDMWMPPAVLVDIGEQPVGAVGDGDAVVFVNFRSDRTQQLADMMAARIGVASATGAARRVEIVSLAQYDTTASIPALVPRADASGGLADELEAAGVRSVRIAESEKFEHVTYFLNGRDGRARPLEEWARVPTAAGDDYVGSPAMNLAAVADAAVAAGNRPDIGLVVANLSNIDVVGHSGDFKATVLATEAVDAAVGGILAAAAPAGRWVMIVGDHGNGEQMLVRPPNERDRPYGGHTANPVPVVVLDPAVGPAERRPLRPGASLAAVAPTVLRLLGLEAGAAMQSDPLL